MPPIFGLVSEGPNDHVVIRHVLAGFYDAPDVVLNPLQPVTDRTGGLQTPGGWVEVLRFCASGRFEEAFQFNQDLIVQIDTDVCEESGFGVPRRDAAGRDLSPVEMVESVRARIEQSIGPAVLERRKEHILFAICVESIECWLLPLYWTDSRREKTVNCLGTLNEKLSRQEGFSIDPQDKHAVYYRRICKPYAKRRVLLDACRHNPSFTRFVAQLPPDQGAPEP